MSVGGARREQMAVTSLAAAIIAVVLTGCAPGTAQPAPLPDGVTVAFAQQRSDVAARQAQVRVHNGTDAPLAIGDVAVTDPRFEGVAARPIDGVTSVRPGATVDIRVQLPEMHCDTAEGESTVELQFVDGATEITRVAPLPDTLGFLPPLHERECRAQALADAATVELVAFTPSAPGVPAELVLAVTPSGVGGARLVGVHTTNLLAFRSTDGSPGPVHPLDIEIMAGGGAERVVLPLIPHRCDPHAVQEDKRGTVFTVDVEVGGEPGIIELAASEEMRGRILTWVGQWCGFGQ